MASTAKQTILGTFAGTYSYSLQQMLYALGSGLLSAVPELCEVRLALPNKHHFIVDLAPFGLENDREVYHADDRPYGLIEGTVLADDAPEAGPRLGLDPGSGSLDHPVVSTRVSVQLTTRRLAVLKAKIASCLNSAPSAIASASAMPMSATLASTCVQVGSPPSAGHQVSPRCRTCASSRAWAAALAASDASRPSGLCAVST